MKSTALHIAWLLQVTEIDTLIGDPVVWQEQATGRGSGLKLEAAQNPDSPQPQGSASRGVEAGVQTDDLALAAEEEESQLRHSQGLSLSADLLLP